MNHSGILAHACITTRRAAAAEHHTLNIHNHRQTIPFLCLQVTAANDDYTHNNISHEFLSTKSQALEAIFRVFTLLLPDSLFTFSAAKYCKAGHIKPHDDRAYTQVCT